MAFYFAFIYFYAVYPGGVDLISGIADAPIASDDVFTGPVRANIRILSTFVYIYIKMLLGLLSVSSRKEKVSEEICLISEL